MIDQTQVRNGIEPPPVVVPAPVERVCLDLGAGQSKREGFKGVDKYEAPGVDIVCDLLSFPWPFEDNSVDEVHSSHFLEHVDGVDRLPFFNELYRVMKPGATAQFITTAADSNRSIQDPTHKFPPVVAEFYQCYLNKAWRDMNKLTHGAYEGDFNLGAQQVNVGLSPAMQARNDEFRTYAMTFLRNATTDLYVWIVKC